MGAAINSTFFNKCLNANVATINAEARLRKFLMLWLLIGNTGYQTMQSYSLAG